MLEDPFQLIGFRKFSGHFFGHTEEFFGRVFFEWAEEVAIAGVLPAGEVGQLLPAFKVGNSFLFLAKIGMDFFDLGFEIITQGAVVGHEIGEIQGFAGGDIGEILDPREEAGFEGGRLR